MTDIENLISGMSYTNKDFQSIYTELLSVAKKLSYKWDPEATNESDPLIVLIKELALIADKLNYNIDKNTLENFPISVTQQSNARNIFSQLGYNMRWYESSVTTGILKYTGDSLGGVSIKIPMFTMVCNEDKSKVYTILDSTNKPTAIVISDDTSSEECMASFNLMQGIVTTLTINSSECITAQDVDSNNRIYFDDYNVAQNGIFISSYDEENYTWERCENICAEALGNYLYEFGVDSKSGKCFIEFPEDYASLFGSGITVKYLKSDGESGNATAKELSAFYQETVGTYGDDQTVVLNEDNVLIRNTSSATDGKNPETIEEAYKGYKKVKGTFDTIVSLRDYNNAIYNSELVSNGFVSDRTSDPQSSYYIMYNENGLDRKRLTVQSGSEHKMNAFDLRLYVFEHLDKVETATDFDTTFTMRSNFCSSINGASETSTTLVKNIEDYLEDSKCVQHDFRSLDNDRICYIENIYPMNIRVIPQYRLSDTQVSEVTVNIQSNLYSKLCSKNISFGEEPLYDVVYDIVMNSDDRIKAIAMDNLEFESYAVYRNSTTGSMEKVKISGDMLDQLSGYRVYDTEEELYRWYETRAYNSTTEEYEYSDEIEEFEDDTSYFDNLTCRSYKKSDSSDLAVDSVRDYATEFQNEIYAKSILCGVTKLFTKESQYEFSTQQVCNALITDINYVTTNTDVIVEKNSDEEGASGITQLGDNEGILLYAPNFEDDTEYSTYVKVLWNLVSNISANSIHTLLSGEKIVFFYKSSDEDTAYTYVAYGEGTTIHTTDTLSMLLNSSKLGSFTAGNTGLVSDSGTLTNSEIESIANTESILSATYIITIKSKNEITITSDQYCYWQLNYSDNGFYKLFDTIPKNSTVYYVLKENEMFIHMNSSKTEMEMLYSGTKITVQNTGSYDVTWTCEVVDSQSIQENGISALENYVVKIPDNCVVTVTSMQRVSVGNYDYIKLTKYEWDETDWSGLSDDAKSGAIEISGDYIEPEDVSMIPTSSTVVVNKTYQPPTSNDAYSWNEDAVYSEVHFDYVKNGSITEYIEVDGTPISEPGKTPGDVGLLPGDGSDGTYRYAYNRNYSTASESWIESSYGSSYVDVEPLNEKIKWILDGGGTITDFIYIPAGYNWDDYLMETTGSVNYGTYTDLSEYLNDKFEDSSLTIDITEWHVYSVKLRKSASAHKVFTTASGVEITAQNAAANGVLWLPINGISNPNELTTVDTSVIKYAVNLSYNDDYYVWLSDPYPTSSNSSTINSSSYGVTPDDVGLTAGTGYDGTVYHAYNPKFYAYHVWTQSVFDTASGSYPIYDSTTIYYKNNLIVYGDLIWRCTATSVTGKPPRWYITTSTEPYYWAPYAQDADGEFLENEDIEWINEDISGGLVDEDAGQSYRFAVGTTQSGNQDPQYAYLAVAEERYMSKSWTSYRISSDMQSNIHYGKRSTAGWAYTSTYVSKSWSAKADYQIKAWATVDSDFKLKFSNDGIYESNDTTPETWTKLDNLQDYSIEVGYKDGDEVTWNKLERISSSDAWEGNSTLDISVSPDTPLVLNENQTFSYIKTDGTTGTLSGKYEDGVFVPLYLLSDYSYDLSGGININVMRTNLSKNFYMNLYSYEKFSDTESPIQLILAGGASEYSEIKFSLPPYKYLCSAEITLNTTDSDLTLTQFSKKFTIEKNGTETEVTTLPISILPSSLKKFKNGTNMFIFDNTAYDGELEHFYIKYAGAGSVTLTVKSIEQYSITDSMDEAKLESVMKKMQQLDKDNSFNYMYDVKSDEEISDPLNADNFFSVYHPYSKYTIGRMDLDTDSIYITNKISSK